MMQAASASAKRAPSHISERRVPRFASAIMMTKMTQNAAMIAIPPAM